MRASPPAPLVRAIPALLAALAAGPIHAPPVAAVPGDEPIPAVSHQLTLHVRDALTGAPLPARLTVIGSGGEDLYPPPRASHFFHESYFGMRYFYADGDVTLPVPEGRTVVRISHGFEYAPVIDSLDVDRDLERTVYLSRVVDMPALGWHGGDTHIHMDHGGLGAIYRLDAPDLFLMQRAEDLHVANVLDNSPSFTGTLDALSTDDYKLFFGIEYRSAFWGHLGVLGTPAATAFGCCSKGQPAFPMNMDLVRGARSMGGTVVFAHPVTVPRDELSVLDAGWPFTGHGRELPIDVALGDVDAIDVLSYSNLDRFEYSTWYDLLGHGFHVPATAGTDAAMNRWYDPPLGGFRVYASTGVGPWSYDAWLAAVRQGHSFVTNGPLFRFLILDNERPGGTIQLSAANGSRTLYGSVDAVCAQPLDQVQILVNGQVAAIVLPGTPDRRTVRGSFQLNLRGRSAWVAARAIGHAPNPFVIGAQLEAHTNPIYVSVSGAPLRFGGVDPGFYVRWIDEVWSLAQAKGFASAADQTLVAERVQLARRGVLNRTTLAPPRNNDDEPPDPEQLSSGAGAGEGRPPLLAVPNPSTGNILFTLSGLPDRPERFVLYDVQGRLVDVRRIASSDLDDAHWEWRPAGAAPLAPGLYFAVFEGAGWTRRVRIIRAP